MHALLAELKGVTAVREGHTGAIRDAGRRSRGSDARLPLYARIDADDPDGSGACPAAAPGARCSFVSVPGGGDVLLTCGSNGYNRLGHLSSDTDEADADRETRGYSGTTSRLGPVVGLHGSSVASVACGSAHTLVAMTDGSVFTFGKCHTGQLGHGNLDTDEPRPRLVEAFAGRGVASDAAAGAGAVGARSAVTADAAPARRIHIVTVGAGTSHSAAIDDTGRLYVWGNNYHGCLGFADECHRLVPTDATPHLVQANALSGAAAAGAASPAARAATPSLRAVQFAGGDFHSLVLVSVPVTNEGAAGAHSGAGATKRDTTATGTHMVVYAAGRNDHGQLGVGEGATYRRGFARVALLSSSEDAYVGSPTFIAASAHSSAAVTAGGALFVWGTNAARLTKLGGGDVAAPSRVHMPTTAAVSAVALGTEHAVVVTADGSALGAGNGANFGARTLQDTFVPIAVRMAADPRSKPGDAHRQAGDQSYVSAACGDSHTLLIDSDGVAWVAGRNDYGKCGHSSARYVDRFTRLDLAAAGESEGTRVARAVLGGSNHTAVLVCASTHEPDL